MNGCTLSWETSTTICRQMMKSSSLATQGRRMNRA